MVAMPATIAVEELRVGMFVHLDLGWWAHPFALSSFRLTSPEQIATIRGLGLKQVRWSPDKSVHESADVEASEVTNAPVSGAANDTLAQPMVAPAAGAAEPPAAKSGDPPA